MLIPALLLALQVAQGGPRITGAISADSRSIVFTCATGPMCPVQFGSPAMLCSFDPVAGLSCSPGSSGVVLVADGTPQVQPTVARVPSGMPELAFFALRYNVGLRIGSNAVAGCTTQTACVQDGVMNLEYGEIPLGKAWAYPDGTWHDYTDYWLGAAAPQPVVNIVTDGTVACELANAPASVTVTCYSPILAPTVRKK